MNLRLFKDNLRQTVTDVLQGNKQQESDGEKKRCDQSIPSSPSSSSPSSPCGFTFPAAAEAAGLCVSRGSVLPGSKSPEFNVPLPHSGGMAAIYGPTRFWPCRQRRWETAFRFTALRQNRVHNTRFSCRILAAAHLGSEQRFNSRMFKKKKTILFFFLYFSCFLSSFPLSFLLSFVFFPNYFSQSFLSLFFQSF